MYRRLFVAMLAAVLMFCAGQAEAKKKQAASDPLSAEYAKGVQGVCYKNRGLSYGAMAKLDEAKADFAKAKQLDPKSKIPMHDKPRMRQSRADCRQGPHFWAGAFFFAWPAKEAQAASPDGAAGPCRDGAALAGRNAEARRGRHFPWGGGVVYGFSLT
jgi:tetratricopeptide (TPR) repeat protein